jgi:hypothetical protein
LIFWYRHRCVLGANSCLDFFKKLPSGANVIFGDFEQFSAKKFHENWCTNNKDRHFCRNCSILATCIFLYCGHDLTNLLT